MDVFETVKKTIVDTISCKEEDVTLEANIKELGADSIDAVQIIMDLEEVYGIEIDADDAGAFVTVNDVVKYIEEHK